MFRIEQYTKEREWEWNEFVSRSKNGTFLIDRRYMDYHIDRFGDYSLMIYRENSLYALLPAHRDGTALYTHQGLTYGGYIMSNHVSTTGMMEVVRLVNVLLQANRINKMIYRAIPSIYHIHPAEEDLYAFFRYCNIKIIGCNIASAIFQRNKIKLDKSRKYGMHKALSLGLKVTESNDFASFWEILQNNLKNKYDTRPVHSLDEIELLRSRFPENIKLYLVYNKDEKAIGGTVLYITRQVVHAQYASASPEGQESGSQDILFNFLINEKYADYPYFDFGYSTEKMGTYLNENLIFQKEGFGARGIVYNTYELEM